ncbi:MAG: hypothetical protein ABSB40_12025 [Nitrososphaeria archaeon]|jgi:hypothetical protein
MDPEDIGSVAGDSGGGDSGGGMGGMLSGIMGGGKKSSNNGVLSQIVSEQMAGTQNSTPNLTGTAPTQPSPTGVSSSSSSPSTATAAQAPTTVQTTSSGDINRQNPYQTGPTTQQQIGSTIQNFQKGMGNAQKQSSAPMPSTSMPGNTYAALFASQTTPGNLGGGQIGVQSPSAISNVQPVQVQSPTVPSAPQVAMPPPAPPAPMPSMQSVSDVRAKYKIQNAQDEVDRFLSNIYNNLLAKRGNK